MARRGGEARLRCGQCGRARPESETVLVHGHRTGDYRRSGAQAMRRVCRDCTVERVAHARQGQAEGLQCLVDSHAVCWSQAATLLGIDWLDLWRNEHDRRRREGA